MSDHPPPGALSSPSAARNRDPIFRALEPYLRSAALVLEVASGSGEHALYNAARMPHLQWLPTDIDDDALASIAAWRDQAALPNLLPPRRLDVSADVAWPVASPDAVVSINMIHIAPWSAAKGLIEGAGRVLPRGGVLFLYGPYLEQDTPTAPSNLDFDRSLRSRNSAWGLRSVEDVTALAGACGLKLEARIAMPANNLSLVFRKS